MASAPGDNVPQAIRLADYAAPDWLIKTAHLTFDLKPRGTIVVARLQVARNTDAQGAPRPPLMLDGEELELEDIRVNGAPLAPSDYVLNGRGLVIPAPPGETFTLETRVRVNPADNTALSGLYRTGGNYCTQCEAEGFRRITFWPDRPDVLARFTVRIEADRIEAPVLLSNGNLTDSGDLEGGRHFAVWEDPFPKPSYLFALAGGDLGVVEDTFTTRSGREVALRIFVRKGKESRALWAMESLKAAMAWDEERFGLEYDLDIYNIVAVPDFNMGAMENKSLNVFNDKYILADAETATDADHENAEAVIGHEYFHNWTGNRVTCRNWFQLCLKEGLTVFRDQEFTSDLRSRAVKRIADVRNLRARQFPEDAGPLAHPVRPDTYAAIDNFYTATVYEKGAEVVRMIHTLIGEEDFMRGMALYLSRFDGTAAAVEDFVSCMAEASGRDLDQFMLWYTQAGTPHVIVTQAFDEKAGTFTLGLRQRIPQTPGQKDKKPHHIPLKIALLDGKGRAMPLRTQDGRAENGLVELRHERDRIVFTGVREKPVLSLNRGFSAPVRLQTGLSEDELLFLLAHDDDPFNRWEAGQTLARKLFLDAAAGKTVSTAPLAAALEALIARYAGEDPAFLAELLRLPGVNALSAHVERDADPQAIHGARNQVLARLGQRLEAPLRRAFDDLAVTAPYAPDAEQSGRRAARAAILALLVHARMREGAKLALETFQAADNMTETALAMSALTVTSGAEREEALDAFIARFGDDHLLVDKWLAWQAMWPYAGCVDKVRELMDSRWFDLANPNKARSLIGVFATANPAVFNRADGSGYGLVADTVIRLDALNPQVAARLATAFRSWRALEPKRRRKAKEALQRIAGANGLSRDTRDIVTRSLAREA